MNLALYCLRIPDDSLDLQLKVCSLMNNLFLINLIKCNNITITSTLGNLNVVQFLLGKKTFLREYF